MQPPKDATTSNGRTSMIWRQYLEVSSVVDAVGTIVGEGIEVGAVYVAACIEGLLDCLEASCLLRAALILESSFLPVLMAFSSRPSTRASPALEAISRVYGEGWDCPVMSYVDRTKNDAAVILRFDQVCQNRLRAYFNVPSIRMFEGKMDRSG